MEKGSSKYEKRKNQETFKVVPTFKQTLRAKLEKKRKVNLSKVNSMKIKKVVL
jgi:hypothetical protein